MIIKTLELNVAPEKLNSIPKIRSHSFKARKSYHLFQKQISTLTWLSIFLNQIDRNQNYKSLVPLWVHFKYIISMWLQYWMGTSIFKIPLTHAALIDLGP